MANGRMIQKSISKSHDVATLMERVTATCGPEHGAYAALFFSWCIPHQDVEGRMHGDPRIVRSDVFPLLENVTVSHVVLYLRHMADLGLVEWYEVDGRKWLSFPGFEKSQPGMRKDREPASKIPSPNQGSPVIAGKDPAVIRQESAKVAAQENRNRKEVEEKRRDPDSASPKSGSEFDFEAVYAVYPRKEGKKKGLQRCRSQITSRLKYDALLNAVKNYAARNPDPQFCKHFDSFMSCWEDYEDAGKLTPIRVVARAVAPPIPGYAQSSEEKL